MLLPVQPQSREFATFNRACERRGLSPEGFDVQSTSDSAGATEVLITLGGKAYRYSGSDQTWAERFFMDIGDDGDAGDGVTFMTSEEERRDDESKRD